MFQVDQALKGEFEEILGAKLFTTGGGLKLLGKAKHVIVYDPNAATNHFEGKDQDFDVEVPNGHYVRIIGPARIKFTEIPLGPTGQ